MFAALVAVELVLPKFNALLQTDLRLVYFGDGGVVAELVALVLIVGVVAGSYPAFYLSAFDSARVLKGDVAGGRRGASFRSMLVVAQFSIAIALVICATVVFQQMRFTSNLDLGFNKDQIVVVSGATAEGLGSQWPTLKERLLQHPGIASVTASHYTPFSFDDNSVAIRREGSSSFNRIQYMVVDYDFFETYEIDMVAGRTFSRDFQGDTFRFPSPNNPGARSGFIVNEAAARLLGLTPSSAAEEIIELGNNEQFTLRLPGPIVGVARDTYFESVHVSVRPILYLLSPEPLPGFNRINFASVRVGAAEMTDALAHIDAVWREFMPAHPVSRHFLDVDHAALYQAERRQEQTFFAFSGLAILIACLGLLGLASYSTEQRTKEIGVRKVMGGTTWDIVKLFATDFGRLVLAANLLAWPAAYFLMQRWLTNFAYRIDLSVLTFVGSTVLALVIAGMTVGAVAARAASARPIHSLRYE
jgi:putative ABC transport system permease protein